MIYIYIIFGHFFGVLIQRHGAPSPRRPILLRAPPRRTGSSGGAHHSGADGSASAEQPAEMVGSWAALHDEYNLYIHAYTHTYLYSYNYICVYIYIHT